MKMHHSTQSNSNFVTSRPADSAAMERWKVAVVTDEAADTWADGRTGGRARQPVSVRVVTCTPLGPWYKREAEVSSAPSVLVLKSRW